MAKRYLPYFLIAPSVVFLCVFFLYPFSLVAWQAFATDEGQLTTQYISKMVNYWKFDTTLRNTLLLAAAVIPIQLALALLMATMVTKMQRSRDAVLYIWTIPLGISDLAAGLIWLAILEQTGYLSSMLYGLGATDAPTTFLGYQNKLGLFIAVMLAEIWRATAIMLVIIVAGIGLIPKEYYEAAEVFGAGAWKRFTRVTFPLLRPSLQTALVLRVILAFEVFAVVVALSGTQFPVLMSEVYERQFTLRDTHVAAAYAMLILGISIVFTLLILWLLRVPKEARV